MAELAITSLTPTANTPSKPSRIQVGESVAEGDLLRKSGSKYYLAKNDTADNATVVGMAMQSAATNGYVFMLPPGAEIDIGVSTTSGQIYCVASTGGQAEDHASVATTEFVSVVFIGTGSSVVTFKPVNSGYAKP